MTRSSPKKPDDSKNSGEKYQSKTLENLILLKIDLERALGDLKFIDQCVLLFRFWEGEQLDKVASRLNMNAKAVSAIEQRAIKKLKNMMTEKDRSTKE